MFDPAKTTVPSSSARVSPQLKVETVDMDGFARVTILTAAEIAALREHFTSESS